MIKLFSGTKRKPKTAGSNITLGVHLYPTGVSLVVSETTDSLNSIIKRTKDLELLPDDDRPIKEQYASLIRKGLDELGIQGVNSVLSVNPMQVVTRLFVVPQNLKERQIKSAAELEASNSCDWPIEQRIMALDDLPNSSDKLMSIVQKDDIMLLMEIAATAGIKVIGIDTPIAAWQRSMREHADAVLDLSHERPVLFIFGDPIGEQRKLPARMSTDKLASTVRTNLVAARKDGIADVRSLAIFGKYEQTDTLIDFLKRDQGLNPFSLSFGEFSNPPWAYAAALASWAAGDKA